MPKDRDGDGVLDRADKCPNTPKGAKVNRQGCWVLKGIEFDTGKSTIKSQSTMVLDEVVAVLMKNPSLKVEVQGMSGHRKTIRPFPRGVQTRSWAIWWEKGLQKTDFPRWGTVSQNQSLRTTQPKAGPRTEGFN